MTKTDYQDFGREVFPASVRTGHVQAHLFDDYWEDIGTIRAFYEANLSLCQKEPPFELAVPGAPIFTRPRFMPPSRFDDVKVTSSLITDGCRIGPGTIIENSVIGVRSNIGANVTIRNSVLMGADAYETIEGIDDAANDRPPLGFGDGCHIEGAILDKNCRIGRNVRIVNDQNIETTDDAEDCMVVDGIPVVLKGAALPDEWKL